MTDPVSAPGFSRIKIALGQFERLPTSSKAFLPRVKDLFAALNSMDGLSPSIADKVTYLGQRLKEITAIYRNWDDIVFNLYSVAITCNSMLLQEGLLYNMLYYYMNKRFDYLVDPLFAEANKVFGPISFGMVFSLAYDDLTKTAPAQKENVVTTLVSDIKEINPDLTEHECKTLFAMTNGVHLAEDGALMLTNLNSIGLIMKSLTSDSKDIRTFAAHLASVYIHGRLVTDKPTLFQISSFLIHRMKKLPGTPNDRVNPLVSLILETQRNCKDTGKDLNFEIYSAEFVSKFRLLTSGDWLDEQVAFYGINQRIIDKCKKCLIASNIKGMESGLLENQKDLTKQSLVWIVSDIVNELLSGKKSAVFPFQASKSPRRFPVSQAFPLLESEEAFRQFCIGHSLYNELDERIRARNAIYHTLIREYYFPKTRLDATDSGAMATTSDADVGGGGASAGAGGPSASSSDASSSTTFEVALKDPLHEPLELTSTEHSLDVKAADLLVTFSIHPRIRAWQRSIEAGLAHYHYDESIPGSLPRDEMIIRHRLPPQLFKLAFRPEFCFESLWPTEAALQQRHFASLLYIDDEPYILEGTIDHDGILYHFYARKVTSAKDFATRGIIVNKETSLSEPVTDSEDPFLETVCGGEVVYTSTEDAMMTFEGHVYKLLKKL